jgi:hypothetical protein
MNKTRSKKLIVALNLHHSFEEAESIALIFFIFWSSKIYVSPIGVVSSLSSPECHLSFSQRCHTSAPCRASFLLNQDELVASASSSGNASSHRLSSRAKIETLNLHHHSRSPSPDRLTPTLHYYKKLSQSWSLSLPLNRVSILPPP